jgi:hypothetical protein
MIGGVKHVVVNEGQEETFLELFRTLKAEMTKQEPGRGHAGVTQTSKWISFTSAGTFIDARSLL